MNWQRELEARLADDPRLERKGSRTLPSDAFFFDGKEVANFPKPGCVNLRMTAAGIFAMGARIADEQVLEVSTDWILLRLTTEDDLSFAQEMLERIFRARRAIGRPKGKQTRRSGTARGSKAMKAFEDAQALKALKNFKAPTDE